LFTASFAPILLGMVSGNTDTLGIEGRVSMRTAIGIVIALPVAAIFCLVYMTMLMLEAWRE
jgi:hypothetical protein